MSFRCQNLNLASWFQNGPDIWAACLMQSPAGKQVQVPPEASARLPRRDWIILPLLVVITIIALAVLGELTARTILPTQDGDSCLVHDKILGSRATPNCTSYQQTVETASIEYHYNECGFRTAESCGPKNPSTIRVAMIGSSISMGYLIPYDQTIDAQLTRWFTGECRRPVEFQSLGLPHRPPEIVVKTVDEAISLNPDLIIWLVTAFDLRNTASPDPSTPLSGDKSSPSGLSLSHAIKYLHKIAYSDRLLILAQHYLFKNLPFYIASYLRTGDSSDFLRLQLPAVWQARVKQFSQQASTVGAQAKALNIPFAVVLVPQAAQAALATGYPPQSGVDPFSLGRQLTNGMTDANLNVFDGTQAFTNHPWSPDYFYMVDGHMAASGAAILAQSMADWLTKPGISIFDTCKHGSNTGNGQRGGRLIDTQRQ